MFRIVATQCFCDLSVFTINGETAAYEDFGDKYDADEENAPDYGCGNMKFFPKPATQAVLDKYRTTTDEYNEICAALEAALSFGECEWCS